VGDLLDRRRARPAALGTRVEVASSQWSKRLGYDKEGLSELRVATAALADDLVALWRACERIDGPNLSEQLVAWARHGCQAASWSRREGGSIGPGPRRSLFRHRPAGKPPTSAPDIHLIAISPNAISGS
jgi:hypothetical protein